MDHSLNPHRTPEKDLTASFLPPTPLLFLPLLLPSFINFLPPLLPSDTNIYLPSCLHSVPPPFINFLPWITIYPSLTSLFPSFLHKHPSFLDFLPSWSSFHPNYILSIPPPFINLPHNLRSFITFSRSFMNSRLGQFEKTRREIGCQRPTLRLVFSNCTSLDFTSDRCGPTCKTVHWVMYGGRLWSVSIWWKEGVEVLLKRFDWLSKVYCVTLFHGLPS